MLFYPVPNTVQVFTHCFLSEKVEFIKRTENSVHRSTCHHLAEETVSRREQKPLRNQGFGHVSICSRHRCSSSSYGQRLPYPSPSVLHARLVLPGLAPVTPGNSCRLALILVFNFSFSIGFLSISPVLDWSGNLLCSFSPSLVVSCLDRCFPFRLVVLVLGTSAVCICPRRAYGSTAAHPHPPLPHCFAPTAPAEVGPRR